MVLDQKEQAAILFRLIDQLPENQKTAFILLKSEELSYQEIAQVMNLSVSAVESLLFRARQNLRKLLESQAARKGGNSRRFLAIITSNYIVLKNTSVCHLR